MMTPQQLFDAVAKHLLTQGQKSRDDNGNCLYRGPDNLKCAIGALIRDECYSPRLETKYVGSRSVCEALICSGVFERMPASFDRGITLLALLQQVHDDSEVATWREDLTHLARRFELDLAVLTPGATS